MHKITWVNLLHFYQPPTADNETVIEAAEKSYKKIIHALKENSNIKFTFNLTGCLLERLDTLGYGRLIDEIRTLREKKQIEITGTAAFHPILPLIPESEVKRNVQINQAILKKYFGKDFQADGFFPPELAYSPGLAKIIAELGYKWIIMDEISAYGALNALDFNKLYIEEDTGLKIFFRSRALSRSYVPAKLAELAENNFQGLALTATDAELYGLRHHDYSLALEKLLKRPEIDTLTVSDFLSGRKNKIKLKPLSSSWESTARELKRKAPFVLWHNDKNKIQELLWRLADLAITTVNQRPADATYSWARLHLDRGLSSCAFWWASGRDFKLFSSISWSPDEIERGANELIRSIRSLTGQDTKPAKIDGEKLYLKITKLVWHKHWNYYWAKANKNAD